MPFLCVTLALVLISLIGIKYSPTNFGWIMQKDLSSRIALSNVMYHLKTLWKYQLTLPIFLLSLISICRSVYKKDERVAFFLLFIVGYYFQITFIGAQGSRFSIYWIPFFCFFSAIIINIFKNRLWKILFSVFLVVIACYQFAIALNSDLDYASGVQS